jgi:hypothetical protein
MKPKYLTAILLLIITGCKKEAPSLSSQLQGTWELAATDGGFSGHHEEYAPGNGNIYSFSGTTYTRQIKTTDTTYEYSGTFEVYEGKPCYFATKQTLIKFDHGIIANSFALLDGTLSIGSTECVLDGSSDTYRKIH